MLARAIQSRSGNATRFVEVSLEGVPCDPEAPCKTSMILSLDHAAGALGEVLTVFGQRGIQLLKLESRPLPESEWKYRFYIDVEAHKDAEPMVAALAAIGPLTHDVRLLGTYSKALEKGELGPTDRS